MDGEPVLKSTSTGPNALVGERGSGKAAVFDALKLVLQDAADEITWSFYRANQATS